MAPPDLKRYEDVLLPDDERLSSSLPHHDVVLTCRLCSAQCYLSEACRLFDADPAGVYGLQRFCRQCNDVASLQTKLLLALEVIERLRAAPRVPNETGSFLVICHDSDGGIALLKGVPSYEEALGIVTAKLNEERVGSILAREIPLEYSVRGEHP